MEEGVKQKDLINPVPWNQSLIQNVFSIRDCKCNHFHTDQSLSKRLFHYNNRDQGMSVNVLLNMEV